jgi:3-hydroxyisobutyrate dehydrogenase-like beta-hydroxyacid dehydrogenase
MSQTDKSIGFSVTYSGILTSSNIPDPGFKLSLALKDINLALAAGEMARVTLPIASLLRDRLLTGVAKCRGDLDLTRL